jgi:Zn-dependent protease with chaperone function
MQRLTAAFGHTRLFRALTHPYTRTALRTTRTLALAGSIGFAGYASGVHDTLADPEEQAKRMLAKVLSSHGGPGGVLAAEAPDTLLVTRLGNELVSAARDALLQEVERLSAKEGAGEELAAARAQLRALKHSWRFVVIDNDTINAFVTDILPGYVFVHRGLIDLMRGAPEQLSFIIGHELSHHILDHNEQARNMQLGLSLLQLLVIVAVDPTGLLSLGLELGTASTLLDYSLTLPASRGHESEADALGLQLVTRACRDPRKAIQAHATLATYEERHGRRPTMDTPLSATHPATLKRLADLQQMLPEAEAQYKQSGCRVRMRQLWRALEGRHS